MRFIVLPASVLVPTLGSPVLPLCCFAGVSADSHGSAAGSASTSPPWSPRTARDLNVAHARQLQLEVNPVGLALGLQLGDLATQGFGDFCVLLDLRCLRL